MDFQYYSALVNTRIDINNVANYIFVDFPDDREGEMEYPSQMLPFKSACFRYLTPKFVHDQGMIYVIAFMKKAINAVGLTEEHGLTDASKYFMMRFECDIQDFIAHDYSAYETAYELNFAVWLKHKGVFYFMGYNSKYVSPEGKYIPGLSRYYLPSAFKEKGEQVCRQHIFWNNTAIVPIQFALSLMHCKNVIFKDAVHKHRGATNKNKKNFFRYRVLEIAGTKKTLYEEGNVAKTGIKKALHICRGHFRSYDETKKLFGRVTGTFWIPMHTRGNANLGIVDKDYLISDTIIN
jgi:hypothetical protein